MKIQIQDIILWLMSLFGGLALCGARLGWMLFGVSVEPPDEDTPAFKAWQRKRKWLVVSELSALPAFALLAVVTGRMYNWTMEAVILFSMVLGALGFAFFLDALQTIVRKRVGMGE